MVKFFKSFHMFKSMVKGHRDRLMLDSTNLELFQDQVVINLLPSTGFKVVLSRMPSRPGFP